MTANYALAKECQLYRRDVEGVLTLAAQLLLTPSPATAATSASSTSAASPAQSPSSSSSSHALGVGPLVGAVLTEANTRSLLLNALVRVQVPTNRQTALLAENRYVQAANETAKKNAHQQQQQQQNNGGGVNSGSAHVAGDHTQPQQYRVGRVVGVVPKPGAKAQAGASGAAVDQSQRWLLAVYVGECVEPFHVAALSDDVFTTAEHSIFVQSALSTNRDDGSRRANVLPSQQPALLSAEAAATVQQNLKDVRRVLQVVADAARASEGNSAESVTAAKTVVEACVAEVLQRARGVKRPREDVDSNADKSPNENTQDNAENPHAAFFGSGSASQAARLARLSDDVAARGQQLQQLRQLLQQKDQEVKSALQQQQQAEAQHRGEVDVWRAKAEEQSRAQERAAKEASASLEQRDRLLEEANTKLRRLAGMTTKYKQVVDVVAAMLKRGADGSGEGVAAAAKVMSPDDILAALQHKKIV